MSKTDMPGQNKPVTVKLLDSYRYAWCACGLSKMQPWCDGSHTAAVVEILPIVWLQQHDQRISLCNCKKTGTAPRCDGSHKSL